MQIINRKREVTIGYLANELGVSDRTIMRDIWFLSEFLPITTTPGRNGGVSYVDGYLYCDYKFYITKEQERVLLKIINETETEGNCKLDQTEILILSDIIRKYAKTEYKY